MKKTHYQFGDFKCYGYFKPVGHGWEVGFYFGRETVFVGNFIHQKEAAKWWTQMNREIKSFTKRYWVGEDFSFSWYSKFFSRHLYKAYYTFLDNEFQKYHKSFDKAYKADQKTYNTYKKKWNEGERFNLRRAV